MQVKVELMGALVDYLPIEEKGKTELSLPDQSTITDLLKKLKIKHRVAIAVNDDHDLDMNHELSEGDQVLVFTGVSGG